MGTDSLIVPLDLFHSNSKTKAIMNPMFLVLVLSLASMASATFVITTTTTATALTAARTASFLTGVGLVKAVALGAVLGGVALGRASRNRREAVENVNLAKENDAIFNIVQDSEPHECVQKLICDIATGLMPPSENDIILSLFEHPVDESSPMIKFAKAAKLGKKSRDIKSCEIRYTCPINGLQMEQLLAF